VYIDGVPQPDSYAVFNWGDRNRFRDNFPAGDLMEPRIRSAWYLQAQKLIEDGQLIIPEGYYFVLGDNRDDSDDSRYWGLVPAENIVGRPLVIYWSMNRDLPDGGEDAPSGKLSTLAYTVIHSVKGLRWDRMLRVPH
jgi:signal peptidase I